MDQRAALRLRSAAQKSVPMSDSDPRAGEDLAEWLQEVAKRPWVSGPLSINPTGLPVAGPTAVQAPRLRGHLQNGRGLVALCVLTIAYLQYYYLDVLVQIGKLDKVVVFVSLTAA